MLVVGGTVVVVVVVGALEVVGVAKAVVVVVDGGCSVVLGVVVGDGVREVVVVTGARVVVVTGREVVVVVETPVVGSSRVGADVGEAAALLGVPRLASNFPTDDECTDAAPGLVPVVATGASP
jgi:hypothetical protein